MSELPPGIPPARVPSPRDSAAGLVLRRDVEDNLWKVLMGVRSRRASFMPGHLSFPGGALDPEDDGSFRTCASREIEEETGLAIPPGDWLDGGERITPPMFPKRFRTFFFVTSMPEDAVSPEPCTEEIERLDWCRAGAVVEDWARGACRVAPPVLPILRTLAELDGCSLKELAQAVLACNKQEQRAPRIEFVPGLWMLPVETATLPPATHTNVWMPGGDRFVIIDPGSVEPDENERLLEVVARRRECGSEPVAVVLTHHHRDHVQGAAALARKLDLPLRAHRRTLDLLPPEPHTVDTVAIEDGESLDLGGCVLHAHHTPGHAPGHLAFHQARERWLIAGDLLSGLSTILIDPDQGDMTAYLDSLERMQRLDCRMLFPSHGPPVPGKAFGRLIAHRKQRESVILEQVRSGEGALPTVAAAAYSDVPEMPSALTQRQTMSHLLRLERNGTIVRDDVEGNRWSPTAEPADVPGRIRQRLVQRFEPLHLQLRDDSANHAGHAGASSGGGHYKVTLVSRAFIEKSRLEQHRMVYEALDGLFGDSIHALALKTLTPEEWES